MAGEYVKCPRCELNYMKKGEEYCDVCKAELKKGPKLVFAVDEDDENEGLELCPICHQNYISAGEKMCAKCAEEQDYKENRANADADDESWKEFLDDEEEEEEEDEEMLSLNKLAEEEGEFIEEEEEEDLEEESVEPDDFDIPDVDESDFEDDEEEDYEEDEEDFEDDF